VQTPLSRTSVLIVDDHGELREELALLLEDLGYSVAQAANGQDALVSLRSAPLPGLILLDLLMPVMNGWVFRVEQRQDPMLIAIPIVLISMMADLQRHAVALNAVGYLVKPIDLNELVVLVARYCQ
jgi:CheY-like chemotaxis protein